MSTLFDQIQQPMLPTDKSTSAFTSQQTKKTFTIFHNTTCKSTFVIYLMECRKCHIQYIRKTETAFNQRLKNHRSNAYRPKPDTIPAYHSLLQTLQWQRPRLQQRCKVHTDRTDWELKNYCRENF